MQKSDCVLYFVCEETLGPFLKKHGRRFDFLTIFAVSKDGRIQAMFKMDPSTHHNANQDMSFFGNDALLPPRFPNIVYHGSDFPA